MAERLDWQQAVGDFLARAQEELAQALAGDLTPYSCQMVQEESGLQDAHAAARLRLTLALQFGEVREEGLIRTLLTEEIAAREQDPFQGIGPTLEILSGLLLAYGRSEDEALFTRAKNANFDCFCGYTPGEPTYPQTIAEDDCEFWIELSTNLEEKALMDQLIDSWLAEQSTWRWDNAKIWRMYESWRHNDQGELMALRQLAELAQTLTPWDKCAAAKELAAKLISLGETAEAWQVLSAAAPLLEAANGQWYQLGLGRSWLENCMDIVLHSASEAHREAAWQWSVPYLWRTLDNMHGNLYQKAAQAARRMGQAALALELEQRWEKLHTAGRNSG